MMLSLGSYQFSVSTTSYQQLQRTSGVKWVATPRLNTTPALQVTGLAASTLKLDGVVYPKSTLPLSILSALRTEAQQRTPHWLVDGTGKVWGQWVIQQLQETHTVFCSNGQPRKITFALQLMQYTNSGYLPDSLPQAMA
nr:oxidoreductase [Coxiellaceae bacterium]